MKRAANTNKNEAGQRWSKRLAKTSTTVGEAATTTITNNNNNNNNVASLHNNNAPSVVSLSSNEDAPKPPAPPPAYNFSTTTCYPQDMRQQVENTLTQLSVSLQGTTKPTNYTAQEQSNLLVKESIFMILKFAFSDNTFLPRHFMQRNRQEALVNSLTGASNNSNNNNNTTTKNSPLGWMGAFVEALVIRGDVIPPRSISFLAYDSKNDASTTTSREEYKQQILLKGKTLIHQMKYHVSLFQHSLDPAQQRLCMYMQVNKSILFLWMHVLEQQDDVWSASSTMRQEQLDNVHCALVFAEQFQFQVTSMDVKSLLFKLALYFSFAMNWTREDVNEEQRKELKRLAKVAQC